MSPTHVRVPLPVLLDFPSQETWPRTLGVGGAVSQLVVPLVPKQLRSQPCAPPGAGTQVSPAGGVLMVVT